jgi:hypothetical protein
MPCVYCGADDREVGSHCNHSPTNKHVINDPNKCRFCGAEAREIPGHCNHSPTNKHALAY